MPPEIPRATYPELAANAGLALASVAASLLDRQLARLAEDFEEDGGFTERLYQVRTAKRAGKDAPPLFPKHGGYQNLLSYQVSELLFDLTCRFCDSYISKRSRTHDQMVQAARSVSRNIAEGSATSGASKKGEIKLTKVARASLEELRGDYRAFLRHRNLPEWAPTDRRRRSLISSRPKTADDVLQWARGLHDG